MGKTLTAYVVLRQVGENDLRIIEREVLAANDVAAIKHLGALAEDGQFFAIPHRSFKARTVATENVPVRTVS